MPLTRTGGSYKSLFHGRDKNADLVNDNLDLSNRLKERFIDGKFIEGYSTLQYKKVSEKKLSERVTHIKVDFKLNRELKAPQYKVLLGMLRFKLGRYKRILFGKEKGDLGTF